MITNAEYATMLAKCNRLKRLEQTALGSIQKEAELHEQILAYCRSKGWIAYHGRMDQVSHQTIGQPDFIIVAEAPKFYMIECKRPGGKLSTAQLAILAWTKKLGHPYHIVHSMEEFVEVVK
jgi:hypothetical protein